MNRTAVARKLLVLAKELLNAYVVPQWPKQWVKIDNNTRQFHALGKTVHVLKKEPNGIWVYDLVIDGTTEKRFHREMKTEEEAQSFADHVERSEH